MYLDQADSEPPDTSHLDKTMGNCCNATPTGENPLEVPSDGNYPHYPHYPHFPASSNPAHMIPPQDMVDYPYVIPSEPQQLEHIADREGQ